MKRKWQKVFTYLSNLNDAHFEKKFCICFIIAYEQNERWSNGQRWVDSHADPQISSVTALWPRTFNLPIHH